MSTLPHHCRTHPRYFAVTHPDKLAWVMAATGEGVTYGQLEAQANQGAHLFRRLGLCAGDHVAVFVENHPRFFVCYWAVMRAGLYFTPIATHLTADEMAYIVRDAGAQVVIGSKALHSVATASLALLPDVKHWLSVDEAFSGFSSWSSAIADLPTTPIADEVGGQHMLYSSGTTGKPKGIKAPFANDPIEAMSPIMQVFASAFGFDRNTVYLAPAPLYHSAPLGYGATVMRLGGTVVVMDKFQPEGFMQAVERYRVTHTQVVPTMLCACSRHRWRAGPVTTWGRCGSWCTRPRRAQWPSRSRCWTGWAQ